MFFKKNKKQKQFRSVDGVYTPGISRVRFAPPKVRFSWRLFNVKKTLYFLVKLPVMLKNSLLAILALIGKVIPAIVIFSKAIGGAATQGGKFLVKTFSRRNLAKIKQTFSRQNLQQVVFSLRSITLAKPSALLNGAVVLVLIVVMIVNASFPGRAATYTVAWTSQADFENNQSSTGTATTRTNVDTTSVPGDVKLATYTKSFTESFTAATYKDAGNTNADWNTAQGQLKVPPGGGVTATDLTGKLAELYGGAETLSANLAVGSIVYLGLSNGKLLKYDSSIDITTDLTSRISSFWGAGDITVLTWDSIGQVLYLGGPTAKLAKYIPATDTAVNLKQKISAFFSSNDFKALTFDSINQEIYFVGSAGGFAKYSPTADTATNLKAKISSIVASDALLATVQFANGKIYLSGAQQTIVYDPVTDMADSLNDKTLSLGLGSSGAGYRSIVNTGNITYLATPYGLFLAYDATTGAVTNLTALFGVSLQNGVSEMAYDPVNQLIYITAAGAVLKYSIINRTVQNISAIISNAIGNIPGWGMPNYFGSIVYDSLDSSMFIMASPSGLYKWLAKYNPGSNTAINLTDKISTALSWYSISTLIFDAPHNVLYLGGQSGKLVKYDIGLDTAVDLLPKMSAAGSGDVAALAVVGDVVYIAAGANFAKYDSVADTVTDLSSIIFPFSGYQVLSSLAYDAGSNAMYMFFSTGIFLKYNLAAGTVTNLSAGMSMSYGRTILTIDAVGQKVYIAGPVGKFFQYSITDSTVTELSSLAYKFLPALQFTVSAYDSTRQVLYLGGNGSYLIKYDTVTGIMTDKSSLLAGFSNVNTLTYDEDDSVLFLGGNYSGDFGKYSISNDTFTKLNTRISSFWSSSIAVSATSYAGGKVYLSGAYGKFGRYDVATDTAANLAGKISTFVTWNGTITVMTRDTTNNVIYLGLDNGHFARYLVASNTMEDLTPVIASVFPYYYMIDAMTFDSGAGAIYFANSYGSFVFRYNIAANTVDDLSSKFNSISGLRVNSLAYDANEKVLYLGGIYARKLARYNTPGYAGGGTYPTADTVYDLSSKLSGFLNDNFYPSKMAFDASKSVLYMANSASAGSEVVRYNTTSFSAGGSYPSADTGYNLTPKTLAALGGAGVSISSILIDETNQVLYLGSGGYANKFLKYNTDFYTGGGNYPTADMAYNLSPKLTAAGVNVLNINSLALDPPSNSIFLGGYYGNFAKYSIAADAVVDLTTGFNFGSGDIYAIIFNPVDGKPYVAGTNRIKSGVFGGAVLAQSINVDAIITDGIGWATLTANDTLGAGTITYFLSNNGGSTWVPAAKGSPLNFSTAGSSLRFKAALSDNATVQDLTISYGGYYASGSVKGLKINAGESAVWGSLTWNANPNGQTVKLQTRAAATEGGLTSAVWSPFLVASPGSMVSVENQWLEVNLVLESLGSATPAFHDFSATYIINARPQVQNVVSAQNADGTVALSYQTRDPDSLSGSFDPGFVTPSFQYSTNNGATWNNITTGLPTSATDHKAVDQASWNSYATTWDAKTQTDGTYSATTKIRVTVDDKEPRMNTANATSGTFAIDLKGPDTNKITLDRSKDASQITIGANDNNSDNIKYALEFPNAAIDGSSAACDFAAEIADANHANWKNFTYPSMTATFTDNNDAVRKACVLLKDKFGNISSEPNNFAIAPANPESFQYYDVSNGGISDFRLFLSWGVPDLTAEGREGGINGFSQYEVRRCRDLKENSSCAPSGPSYIDISSKLENYFTDTCADGSCAAPPAGSGMDPAYRYCYNFRIKDQNPDPNNDYSKWSSTLCAVPGAGTSSLSKNVSIHYYPTADENVPEDKLYTTQATIRWQTVNASDPAEPLLSDSTVWWRAQGSSEWTESYTVASYVSDHYITIPGRLSPGTTYEYRVTSTTPWGTTDTSQGSNPATFTTKIGPVIENVKTTDYGNNSATVTWDTRTARSPLGTPNNASSAIYYSPAISATGSLVAPQGGTCGGGFSGSHSCVINGLNPGTPYYYYVYSVLETDAAAFSADTNGGNFYTFTTTTDHSAPVITPGSNPRIVTDTQAAISWGTDERAKSWILYDTATHEQYTFPTLNFNPLIPAHNPYAQNSGNANSNFSHNFVMNVNTLSPNTTYYYRMVSQDTSGNAQVTPEYSFTTLPVQIDHPNLSDPGDPASGNVLMKTDTSALIKVVTNTHSIAKLCYATAQISDADFATCLTNTSGDGWHLVESNTASMIHAFVLGSGATADDPILAQNTQYYYRVQVTDSENSGLSFTSSDSSSVNFTTLADPSQQHAALAAISTPGSGDITLGDKFALVSWTTDQPANQALSCATTTGGPYTLATSDLTSLNKSHTLKLSSLTPDTKYYCQVTSTDDLVVPTTLTSNEFNFTTEKDAAFAHDPLTEIKNISNASSIPPPVITDTKAVITFDTDQPALCLIESGTSSGNYTNDVTKEDGYAAKLNYNLHHSININGLIPATKYYYRINCGDNLDTNISSAEQDFTTTLQQVDHPVLTNPGDPYDVFVSDEDAVIQLPMLNTEATSKLCFSENRITDVDSCSNYKEIMTPSRLHSYYLDYNDLKQNTLYYIRTKVIDSKDGTNSYISGDDVAFLTLQAIEHPDLTDPGNPAIILKSDTEAVIAYPTVNTSVKSRICYGTTENIDIENCPAGQLKETREESRIPFYHLTNLSPKTTYYYKIKLDDALFYDPEFPDEYTFTSQELSFDTLGTGTDDAPPTISNINTSAATGESITITWDTDELANSSVKFGIVSGTFDNMAGNSVDNSSKANYVKAHTVIINNLVPENKYYYSVLSTDAAGNIAESAEANFSTASPSSLSSIKVVSTSLNQAVITWNTSQQTTSTVEYGLTTAYGQVNTANQMTQTHTATIDSLTPNQVYHFRVKGKDSNNNLFSSGDYTFQPKSPPQILSAKVESVNEHGAIINAITNIPTDISVDYTDLTDAKNSGSQGKPDLLTNHSIELKNLPSGEDFSLNIRVRDQDGNETTLATQKFTTGKDETAPVIDQVRTDSALAQNDKVQSIISWNTNEPSSTELSYQEGRAGEKKNVVVNSNLTLNHVAVITTFKPGVVYYFKATSIDLSQNKGESTEYALLTPKTKQNIIQVIITNFQDIFGWANMGG